MRSPLAPQAISSKSHARKSRFNLDRPTGKVPCAGKLQCILVRAGETQLFSRAVSLIRDLGGLIRLLRSWLEARGHLGGALRHDQTHARASRKPAMLQQSDDSSILGRHRAAGSVHVRTSLASENLRTRAHTTPDSASCQGCSRGVTPTPPSPHSESSSRCGSVAGRCHTKLAWIGSLWSHPICFSSFSCVSQSGQEDGDRPQYHSPAQNPR